MKPKKENKNAFIVVTIHAMFGYGLDKLVSVKNYPSQVLAEASAKQISEKNLEYMVGVFKLVREWKPRT